MRVKDHSCKDHYTEHINVKGITMNVALVVENTHSPGRLPKANTLIKYL